MTIKSKSVVSDESRLDLIKIDLTSLHENIYIYRKRSIRSILSGMLLRHFDVKENEDERR